MFSSSEIMNTKQCPFCRAKRIKVCSCVLNVWKCLSCGLLFRGISLGESVVINKEAWMDLYNHRNETGATDIRLSKIYAKKLIASLRLKNIKGLKILDFGTGRGDMLAVLSELGADVYGVEPFGYEYLEDKGFKVFREIEDIPKGFLFDGIIANDVIEHIFCPWDVMDKLYGLLNVSGWLYIATPNTGGLNAVFSRARWREFYNRGHIRFFNSSCLKSVFFKFSITKYKRLRWFIRYNNNPLEILVHYFLQFFRLDGVIRYIIIRSS